MANSTSILEIGMIYTLHEMKNPLTSIILCTETLQSGEAEDPAAEYEKIKKHAMEMKTAIIQLCDAYEEKLQDARPPADKDLEKQLSKKPF